MEYAIEIDASRGLVKATGDKDFIMSIIDRYESLMATKHTIAAIKPAHFDAPESPAATSAAPPPASAHELEDFGSVFDVTDGKISVIASLPGSTQAAKAKNLCLLFLYAKLKLGHEIVQNDEVRDVCKEHAVYDSTNFATQMKSQKKLVIANGTKGSPNFTLKLTVPGRKAAEELAKSLESAT